MACTISDGALQKLLVFDGYADDVKFPGLAPGSVVRSVVVEPIQPISALSTPNVGPGGTVGTWEGWYSNQGYIVPTSPLDQTKLHFEREADSEPISVQFCYDDQLVS